MKNHKDFKEKLKILGVKSSSIQNIIDNYEFTKKRLIALKNEISKEPEINNLTIVVMGSYGRNEASELSDLDAIIIYDDRNRSQLNEEQCIEVTQILKRITKSLNIEFKEKKFCKTINYSEIISNIGGDNDNNSNLTFRMLILLESQPIYNIILYNEILNHLFDLYVAKQRDENKDPLGLINEILRFYRTMCVDYRYKTEELENPWALRTIKLRYSRKFLCFSAIGLILNGIQKDSKYQYILKNINVPPLEKFTNILLESESNNEEFLDILYKFDNFLKIINDLKNRDTLNNLNYNERKKNPIYMTMRRDADIFHKDLINFLRNFSTNWDDYIYKYLIL